MSGYDEAKMGSEFNRWVKKNGWDLPSTPYEHKITKLKSLPFSRLEEHQIYYLGKCKTSAYSYKISDASPGLKPFDGFVFSDNPISLFTIMFYKKRTPRIIYCIDRDDLLCYIETSDRKSLTEDKAKELAIKIINL